MVIKLQLSQKAVIYSMSQFSRHRPLQLYRAESLHPPRHLVLGDDIKRTLRTLLPEWLSAYQKWFCSIDTYFSWNSDRPVCQCHCTCRQCHHTMLPAVSRNSSIAERHPVTAPAAAQYVNLLILPSHRGNIFPRTVLRLSPDCTMSVSF